jgi:iron(III) transport system substrate-binding protein
LFFWTELARFPGLRRWMEERSRTQNRILPAVISKRQFFLGLVLPFILVLSSCQSQPTNQQEVVVYTSVDQPFSEPILDEFERTTGIRVQAVYDVEAAKTTGLVNRLIAEKEHPVADVFWNSEILQTILLKEQEVLAVYHSEEALSLDAIYRDADGYWSSVTARARVILINTDRIPNPESINSIHDFIDPGQAPLSGVANPLFGTTATHAAALYSEWGPLEARGYFEDLARLDVNILDGNSVVRDQVVDGQIAFGLTDTDDACGAVLRGAAVEIRIPDQAGAGTLIIPSTVALISGAPHPDAARQFIDYLLNATVEQALLDAEFSHVPLHPGLKVSGECLSTDTLVGMDVNYEVIFHQFEAAMKEMREVFLR